MNKRRVDGWRGVGDCDKCTHQRICRRACDAHDLFLSRQVRKALLLDVDRKSNPEKSEDRTQ